MDPQATWNELLKAIVDRDCYSASELAESLIDWMEKGGFSPIAIPELGQASGGSKSVPQMLNRLVVYYVCQTTCLRGRS